MIATSKARKRGADGGINATGSARINQTAVADMEYKTQNAVGEINRYQGMMQKNEYLSADDLTAYKKYVDDYISTSDRLRNLNSRFGTVYTDADHASWEKTKNDLLGSFDSASKYYGQFENAEVFRDHSLRNWDIAQQTVKLQEMEGQLIAYKNENPSHPLLAAGIAGASTDRAQQMSKPNIQLPEMAGGGTQYASVQELEQAIAKQKEDLAHAQSLQDEMAAYKQHMDLINVDLQAEQAKLEELRADLAEANKGNQSHINSKYGSLDALLEQITQQNALMQEAGQLQDFGRYTTANNRDSQFFNPQFEELSQYKSTANGQKNNFLEDIWDGFWGTYKEADSGYDDPLYEYVNGNEEAGRFLATMASRNNFGADNIFESIYKLGKEGKTEAAQMEEDEVKVFNYIYATKGREEAYRYYAYLQSDLYKRQRYENEKRVADFANKNGWGAFAASAGSALASPLKIFSFAGQAMDWMEDGKIEQNAAYNQFSYNNSAIRDAVSSKIENSGKWGPVGSFAYQTGMSMADFLVQTGASGGNGKMAMLIMGTGAAADTVLSAKDRGLSDDQAFTLGIVAGVAEAITEKVSLETLLDPKMLSDGALKYVVKNMVAEGSEEGASTIINFVADQIVAADKSELQVRIQELLTSGEAKTEQEAFGIAMAEQAGQLGLDVLGGAISGGVLGGGTAGAHQIYTNKLGNQVGKANLETSDKQAFISEGLSYEKGTEANALAQKLQKKLDAGKKISNTEISRQWQANMEAQKASEKGAASIEVEADYGKWSNHKPFQIVADELGANGKKMLKEVYDLAESSGSDVTSSNFARGVYAYYNAGLTDTPSEQVKWRGNELSDRQKVLAWRAGAQDATVSLRKAQEGNIVTYTGKDAGLAKNELADALAETDPGVFNAAQKIAVSLGTKVMLENLAPGINGNISDGLVTLNAKLLTKNNGKELFLGVLAHEVFHRMKEISPKEATDFQNYVAKITANRGNGNLENTVKRYIEKYRDRTGRKLTNEEAMEEMAADFIKDHIRDTKLFADFVKQGQEQRSWGRRMLDGLKKLIAKIKSKFSSSEAQNKAAVDATGFSMAQIEEAVRRWEAALEAAQKELQTTNRKVEANQTQKNTANGGGKMAIEIFDGRYIPVIDTRNDTRDYEVAEKFLRTLVDINNPFATILSDAQPVYIGKDLPGEYKSSEYTKAMRSALRKVKMQAATNLDEMLLLAEHGEWRENVEEKHKKDAKNGWYRYPTEFAVPILNARREIDHYTIYGATLLIRNDADGKSYLYDMVNLEVKEKKKAISSTSSTDIVNRSEVFEPKPSGDMVPQQGNSVKKFSVSDEVDPEYAAVEAAEEVNGTVRYSISMNDKLADDITNKRYSIEDTDSIQEELQTVMHIENAARAQLDYLRKQVAVTKDATADPKSVERIAKRLITDYGVETDWQEIALDLQNLYDQMLRKSETDWWGQAVEIARRIAEGITEVDGDIYTEYAELRKILKARTIFVPESVRSDIADYFDTVRPYRNRLKLTTKADSMTANNSLDIVFNDLAAEYPFLFDADTNAGSDQLRQIMEVTDRLYERASQRFLDSWEIEDATTMIAGDIIQKASELKQFKSLKEMQQEQRQAQKDATLAGMMAQGRVDAEKIRKVRENLDRVRKDKYAAIQKVKTRDVRIEKMQENTEVKKYRLRVEKKVKKLSDALLKNSDKEHIPENLKQVVGNFLNTIDFSSQRLMKGGEQTKRDLSYAQTLSRLRDALTRQGERQAADNGDGVGAYVDLPAGFVDQITEHIQNVENAARGWDTDTNQVYAMNAAQLKDLDFILTVLNHSISQINQLTENARFASAQEAARESILDLNAMGSKLKPSGKVGELLTGWAGWGSATPFYAFQRYGAGGQAIFEGLQNGWDRMADNSKAIIDFTGKTYTAEEVKSWGKEVHKVDLQSGKTAQLTTAQVMSLYCLAKREQAVGHLLGGGMRVADFDVKGKKVSQTSPYNLTAQDIAEISGLLTDRQRTVADALQGYMNTIGTDWGNEVSMKRFGYRAFTEANYFPITSDPTNLPGFDPEARANDMFRLLNLSLTKSLTAKANNALVISDIFDVFAAHMADMAKYNALALPILDAMKWYNYKDTMHIGESQIQTQTVQRALETAYGKQANNYFTTFMKDLNGKNEGGRGEEISKKLISNYKVAAVGANLRVALLQPTAYVRAAAVVDPKYLAKAFKAGSAFKEMEANSGIAKWKGMGFYDTNIGRGLREQIKSEASGKDKLVEKSMLAAEWGDKLTWGVLWNACKLEVAEKQKLEGQALLDATAKRFRDVVYQTQVVDSTMTRSHVMRNKSLFATISTAFMSEPTLGYNLMMDAALSWVSSGKENRLQAAKKFGRVAAAFCVTSLASTIAASIMDAWRDDDEYEDFYEKFLEAFGENLLDDLNVLNKLPIAKDIMSMLAGFDSTRMDLESIQNLVKVFKIWTETYDVLVNGGEWTDTTYYGKMTMYGKIYKSLQALSQLFGLPISSLAREATSMYNNTIAKWFDLKTVKTYDPGTKASIHNALTDGKISEEEALYFLMNDANLSNDEAMDVLRKWKTGDLSLNDNLKSAFSSGKEIDFAIEELKKAGWTDEDIKSKCSGYISDLYRDSASITDVQACKYFEQYCGLSNDAAVKKVQYLKFQRDYPEYKDLSQNAALMWNNTLRTMGVEMDEWAKHYNACKDFDAKDENGNTVNGLKKQRVMQYLKTITGPNAGTIRQAIARVMGYL